VEGEAKLRRGESNVKREKKTNILVEENSVSDPDPAF
jgi:hypothetical protein